MTGANPISGLNRIFESRVRLGVMSILRVNDSVSFNDLKSLLEVTDGNLATHLVTLETEKYISVHKAFVGKKTNTTYTITKTGEKAFNEHLKALEKLIRR